MFRKLLVVAFVVFLLVPSKIFAAAECSCSFFITGPQCSISQTIKFPLNADFVSIASIMDKIDQSNCPITELASFFPNQNKGVAVIKETCPQLAVDWNGSLAGGHTGASSCVVTGATSGSGVATSPVVNPTMLPVSPSGSGGSGEISPEFNPICWEEDECAAAREKLGINVATAGKGFFPGEEPCNKPGWGKCLPSGVVTTEIAFGGKTEFLHLGDFIKTNYNYAIGIAAILAVIMIIVAGVQWVTSGGNSESISSSKKRIGGALIGLFIAYMSYVILNTINPALVGLRLPQVWLIRESKVAPEYCSDLPKGTLFAFAADNGLQVNAAASSDAVFLPLQNKELGCGKRFFIKGSGSATCAGTFCPGNPQVCVPNYGTNVGYSCVAGNVAGVVKKVSFVPGCINPLGVEGWEADTVDIGETTLYAVCADNDYTSLGKVSAGGYGVLPNGDKYFNFAADVANAKAEKQDCVDNHKGFRGLVILLQMNEDCISFDENHFIGKGGIDLGDETRMDWGGWGRQSDFKFGNYKSQYYYTIEDLEKGIVVSIDSNLIHDIDEDADRVVYDKYLQ
ncbi:MAG: hypothetical protein UR53_C0002G0055 [Candidatus Magasanikbacteria bacterium GW2011_GWC2_34_16]|uniref:Uncharacterized protein n=2 Tax=Candidatus Magasanikiibacteriota TaxID=1752731 RepID=A0A0G0JWI7_9BACT|nr:MAG: hypothetical protein UR53_C0002G0055 [Candidatus Magasanikbacteria bacterium GW2011_GWC2_34_16]KKQ41219.1 MAG: hypothetical protein US58_C0003G0002 [Candidatus Magasanikbacteria bacterium GW2011_GWA2_37_8]